MANGPAMVSVWKALAIGSWTLIVALILFILGGYNFVKNEIANAHYPWDRDKPLVEKDIDTLDKNYFYMNAKLDALLEALDVDFTPPPLPYHLEHADEIERWPTER